jgi:hypothetical protein
VSERRNRYSEYYTIDEKNSMDGWLSGVRGLLSKAAAVLREFGFEEEADDLGIITGIIAAGAVLTALVAAIGGIWILDKYFDQRQQMIDMARNGETRALQAYQGAVSPGFGIQVKSTAAGIGIGTLAAIAAVIYLLRKRK